MNPAQIPFDALMVPLSAALGLSLFIERFIEMFKNIPERFFGKNPKSRRIPPLKLPKNAEKTLEKRFEGLKESAKAEEKASPLINELLKINQKLKKATSKAQKSALEKEKEKLEKELAVLEKEGAWEEEFSNAVIAVEEAEDPDDGLTTRALLIQLTSFALGIILVRATGLQLFSSMLKHFDPLIEIKVWMDYLFTGLLIGGGSKPVHLLIRFITEHKVETEKKPTIEKEEIKLLSDETVQPPAIVSKPSVSEIDQWVEIPYMGGVDRHILEHMHYRKQDPNLIVYHHTAMKSWSTFEDVVQTVKSRTDSKGNHWKTGYHCVICSDGSIHPFCRWDRYGNHAVGFNMRSLGLAFNGNYETDSKVPFSNPDGRMGPPQPTEAQIKAAARVITLWTMLYKIPLDFAKTIIPHRDISTKSCPGSAFPYSEFKKWIETLQKHWKQSTAIKERIQTFNEKPYLHV